MAFLSSMNVVGSGLTAQQLRLDVVSENITNRTTTRTEGAEPTDARWWYLRRRESAAVSGGTGPCLGERSLRHRGRRSGN